MSAKELKLNKKQSKLIEILLETAKGDLMNCSDCYVAPFKKELFEIHDIFLSDGKKQPDTESKLNIGVVSNNEVAVCECSNPEGVPVNKINDKWVCCICNRPLAN